MCISLCPAGEVKNERKKGGDRGEGEGEKDVVQGWVTVHLYTGITQPLTSRRWRPANRSPFLTWLRFSSYRDSNSTTRLALTHVMRQACRGERE